ncbi:hypothetical protein QVD17_09951 [Tagetes erecta]|uniref:Precursor of CEP9 n=1 Tax=Tagetes erecta TaxID=13708 RepID=A0AAD8L8C7_TARER|nr:hypothetical protein QVD17_09951 [Tagetes erecta]
MTHFKTYTCWLIILTIVAHETLLIIEARQFKSMPSTHVAAQSQGKSKPESVNDFRPTAPGNSPGAGHSFKDHRFDTQAGSNPATGPGHSPGGGHSKENQAAKPIV